jgi:hypothetical protein
MRRASERLAGEKKGVHEERNLESTQKHDPQQTEKYELKNNHN